MFHLFLGKQRFPRSNAEHRTRRRLTPSVHVLEGRQLLAASVLTAGVNPSAGMTVVQSMNFAPTPTNFNQTATFNQFDPSLGTLTQIDVSNLGAMHVVFAAENLSSGPSLITGTSTGSLTTTGPSVSLPIVFSPISQSFPAGAYDGVTDDAGTSGQTLAPASSTGAYETALTASNTFTPYIGTGSVSFSESGQAQAQATGGNIAASFTTTEAATITVVYHYTPAANTPAPTVSLPAQPSSNPAPTLGSPTPDSSNSASVSAPIATVASSASQPAMPISTTSSGQTVVSQLASRKTTSGHGHGGHPAPPAHHAVHVRHSVPAQAHKH